MQEPLTHGEFFEWIDKHFFPHLEAEKQTNEKVSRLSVATFGDGNGNSGMHADVKSLMETSKRVDAWLDGIKIIGRIAALAIGIIAAAATAARAFGLI